MKWYYGPVQGQLLKDQQLKNWKFSNEIMLNAIAALEDLAFFYGFEGPKRFEYYSGCADKNNENSLKNAVILQLNLFRCSHSDYTSIYSTYDFPENLSKEEIIKIINEWKKKIPTDRKDTERLFNEILKYLEGDSKNCEISDLIDKAKKDYGPTTKEDLRKVGKSAAIVNSIMSDDIKEVNDNYQKTGDYKVKAKLNKRQEDNEAMQKLFKHENDNKKREEDFKKTEQNILSFFQSLDMLNINSSTLNKEKEKSITESVENFKNLINGVNLKEENINSNINKFKDFKNKISKNSKGENHSIILLKELCDEIIECYNSCKAENDDDAMEEDDNL